MWVWSRYYYCSVAHLVEHVYESENAFSFSAAAIVNASSVAERSVVNNIGEIEKYVKTSGSTCVTCGDAPRYG